MRMLHQHSGVDVIAIHTDEEESYVETPIGFKFDFGKDQPALPPGITERIYEPGKRHALVRGTDVVDGGPLPWPEGDAILNKIKELLAHKKVRDDAARAAAENKLRAEMEERAAQMKEELAALKKQNEQRR